MLEMIQTWGPVLIWRLKLGSKRGNIPNIYLRGVTVLQVSLDLDRTRLDKTHLFCFGCPSPLSIKRCSAHLRSTQTLSPKYNMNPSNPKSSSPARERRRTLMACTNCRSRKLKCRPLEPVDSAPCERCVKEGVFCEYRPVDPSLTSNNHASNYSNQDNPVTLYHVHAAPQLNQESTLPANQSESSYVPTQEGYVPNQTFNPAMQAPFQTSQHYPTPPFQPQHPSYPVTQYSYPTNAYPSGYSTDQSNYQSTSQFGGHPQYMAYATAHGQGNGPYDHRDYPFSGYENMDGSNSARE